MSDLHMTEADNGCSFTDRVDRNLPAWAEHQIKAWDLIAFRQAEDFITHHYWTDKGSINVFRVVGTDHPQYAGMTWSELLLRGKRMDINIPLIEKNPGYYTDVSVQHTSMSYVSLDGIHWYISADGNHRSCLARFYFHLLGHSVTQLHNVSLSQYRTDTAFMSVCQAVSQLAPALRQKGVYLTLTARRLPVSREDTPGWKLDTFRTEVSVTLDNVASGDDIRTFELHSATEAQQLLRQMESELIQPSVGSVAPWWKRLLPFRREEV
ncbi:hypothetical protein L8P91_10055 [Enterobacter bugandensis]|uniref:hypothetical protein n=1 Tax=Enterobacter bugandensis TaxID=881260 RepID=UPI002005AE0B|nr:hypothetical protein [Enterobacter bugandensis]MCK7066539.1 hypothetical protein [Enterobacter bugandensis]